MLEQFNNNTNRIGTDVKCCTKNEFTSDENFHVKQMEENSRIELEMLSNKFKIVCEKLRETNDAFEEAKNIINDDIFNIENTVTNVKNLIEAEYNSQKTAIQIQQLIDDNRVKDEKICFMNKKIKKLQRENQYNVQKINKLKIESQERKLIKENIQLLENNYNRFKQEHDDYLLLEKKLNCMYQCN